MTAIAATPLALCFALIVTRSRLPGRRLVGVLAVLPMITPPFVIGLALIMLFGRSGAINAVLEWAFGIGPSRWIYGLPGRVARADARAHARRLSRARRRRRGDQSEPRGGGTDAARLTVDDVHHGHAAAARAGARQRLSHRVHRKPRRLRQSAAAGRQSRSAVGRHLLRDRRRAAGSRAAPPFWRSCCSACRSRSSCSSGGFSRDAASSPISGKGEGALRPPLPRGGGGHRRKSRAALGRACASSSTR